MDEPDDDLNGAADEPDDDLNGAADEPDDDLNGAADEPDDDLNGAADEPDDDVNGAVDDFYDRLERAWDAIVDAGLATPDVDELIEALKFGFVDLLARRERAVGKIPSDEDIAHIQVFAAVVYEVTQLIVNPVKTAFERQPPEEQARSNKALEQITILSLMAQRLPWPEFGLRAIGAIRGAALVNSKWDTADGYVAAWTLHKNAAERIETISDEINSGLFEDTPYLPQLKRDLHEVEQQTLLTETGTSCRQAEFVLCRWIERVADGSFADRDQYDELARLAYRLQIGVSSGMRSLALVAEVEENFGLVENKTLRALLTYASRQNPGIMTARAFLLLIPICVALERVGRRPPVAEDIEWDVYRADLVAGFRSAYAQIELRPRNLPADTPAAFIDRHKRSIAQLRTAFGVLFPGAELPTSFDPAGGPWQTHLTPSNVDALAQWLTDAGDDANVIGSTNMRAYLEGVEAVRQESGPVECYYSWRTRWLALDRFAEEPGRRESTLELLEALKCGVR